MEASKKVRNIITTKGILKLLEAHRLRLEVLGGNRVLVYDEEVYSYVPRG